MDLAARTHDLTAEDYLALPIDVLPHTQLVDGELVVTEPLLRHQRIVLRLAHSFMSFAEGRRGAGEVGFNAVTPIDDRNVYVPDLWWVADGDLPDLQRLLDPPPPLVAEVRSPSTWRYDTGPKLRGYERVGVAEVWLVDTVGDVVHVHRRSPGSPTFDLTHDVTPPDPLTSPLVPGWQVDLATLLRRL